MSEPNKQDLATFSLLKLPFLAMKNAVKHMGILDIYKFSNSSEVIGSLVKLMKLKTEGINVFATPNSGMVDFLPIDTLFEPTDVVITMDHVMKRIPIQYFFNKEEEFFSDEDADYPQEQHAVPDYLDGCLGMSERLNQIFEMKKCTYHLSIPNKKPETWMQILSSILAYKCTHINITEMTSGESIDKDVLDYLMDNLDLDASLFINADLPENYTHENLFKFQHFFNNNASWVTVDLLKSLRNVKGLSFCGVNFDSKDINEFLRYFINSEEDILEKLRFSIIDGNRFFESDILDQLITVPYVDSISGEPYHLIKVRHSKNRKSVLIKLQIQELFKGIHLETIKDIKKYKVQFETLELLEKENDLEKELGEIEDNENQVEDDASNYENEQKELMERREAIVLELEEVRKKLLYL